MFGLFKKEIPICMDCKHFLRGLCVRQTTQRKNPVDGQMEEVGTKKCSIERASQKLFVCGPKGKYFKPKEKE